MVRQYFCVLQHFNMIYKSRFPLYPTYLSKGYFFFYIK